MDLLLLRFDAPLMSFGGPMVDQRGPTLAFPGLSMLTGLIGNALGYDHADTGQLDSLQRRLRYGVRCDRPGKRILDFQTVDLGQPFMQQGNWTTRGRIEERDGSARTSTHIRYREYLADAVYTLAVGLEGEGDPDLQRVEQALREPERPLFLGRKSCLPAAPLLLERSSAASLYAALVAAPFPARAAEGGRFEIWLPESERALLPHAHRIVDVVDERDWATQIHGARRFLVHSFIQREEGQNG